MEKMKEKLLDLIEAAVNAGELDNEDIIKRLKKTGLDDDLLIENIEDLDRLTEAEGKCWLRGMSTEDAFEVIEPDFDDCLNYADDHAWNFFNDFESWASKSKLEELAKRLSGYIDKNGSVHFKDYLFDGKDIRDLVRTYMDSPYMNEFELRMIVSDMIGLPNYTDDQMLKEKCAELGERLAKAH